MTMPTELDLLKERLRHNERIWNGFRAIELALIGADSLSSIVNTITGELPPLFKGVDRITLACLDPYREMERLVHDEGPLPMRPSSAPERVQNSQEAGFVSLSDVQLAGLFTEPYRPRLGDCDADTQALLFPGCDRSLGSVALAPLVLRGELIGCLSQGSYDATHFVRDTATDLLEHLAAVTAVCIENRLNHERLKIDGLTDALTGIANRRFFERRLIEEVGRVQRAGKPLSCAMIDVDHFKKLNDTHGHRVGDRALHQIAQLLGMELRTVDVLARYGGEEFVLLLPETNSDLAGAIAERLRKRVAARPLVGTPGPVSFTVSIGCASLSAQQAITHRSPEWLVERADAALYEAKKLGRNRVVLADGAVFVDSR